MHEISAPRMREALGVTAYRSSRVYDNVGANNSNNNNTNNNNNNNNSINSNPFQRRRWPEILKIRGFQGWLLEKGTLSCKFHISLICGFPQILTCPTENWGSISCYLLLIRSVGPRLQLGVPPHFSGSGGQKHGRSKIF